MIRVTSHVLNPIAKTRFFNTKLTFVFTVKILIAPFPLIVTLCPLPSKTVSVAITMVFDKTITPSQSNVTVPPPASAVRKVVSSVFVTTPAEKTAHWKESSATAARSVLMLFIINPHGFVIENKFTLGRITMTRQLI
jgi:hypothetical protein